MGALIDEGGDDQHILEENAGAALGFGWDVVNAFLIDRGSGNDRYDAKIISIGLAEVRSNAFFIDEGGDDVYFLDHGQLGLGAGDERDSYREPGRTTTFPFHLGQVGVFLDLGGKDRYNRRGAPETVPDSGGSSTSPADAEVVKENAEDGGTWNVRARATDATGGPNVSYGRDVDGGTVGFLRAWPARVAETPESN